jgi:hypothetical protein
MPKTTPLDPETRRRLAGHIGVGVGRNEIARLFGVSPALVSKIARENGLAFENNNTAIATRARQIDLWAARIERVDQLEREYLALQRTTKADGTPTRRER